MVNFSDGNLKAIFIVFIGAIIAATLIVTIANQTNLETTTFTETNFTVAVPQNGTATDLTGRTLISGDIINSSLTAGIVNVTLRTALSSTTGLSTVQIYNNASSTEALQNVNVTYTYEPNGYVSDSGGRAITRLIVLFAALAIVVFVLVVFIKMGFLGKLLKPGSKFGDN